MSFSSSHAGPPRANLPIRASRYIAFDGIHDISRLTPAQPLIPSDFALDLYVTSRFTVDKNRIEEEMDWSIQQVAKLAGTTSRTGANGYRYYDAPTLARLQRIFDHTAYKQEVESRWGADAYAAGDTWWRSMSADERDAWKLRLQALNADWTDAAARGLAPDSDASQALPPLIRARTGWKWARRAR
jgi:hypothetical protein